MQYNPQKALPVDKPPTGDAWVHELKLDGFRMGVMVDRGAVRIISRRGTDYTADFPEVVRAIRKLRASSAVLDGEVVVLDEQGVSRFQLLQQLGASRRGLVYFAFDVLALDGEDLRKRPLEERKRILLGLVGKGAGVIRYNAHTDSDGGKVFASACDLGAEGIISKRRDGIYRSGARSADWQKIKCIKRLRGAPAPQAAKKTESRLVFPRVRMRVDHLTSLYSEIAEWALPHVEGRPLTLVRAKGPITRTDALRTQAAFVHHTARDQRFVPSSVPRTAIAEKKKTGEYCYVRSVEDLRALIEAGVVEWHVWNARVGNVERPDRVVFDLDPGDDVHWAQVVTAARRLRTLLRRRGLESWVTTTGGKGLHVVVPFRAEHDWDSVFEFSRAVAMEMEDANPELYLTAFDRAARRGKVLIDYKRNYRTSIAVAGFSLRAHPQATISTPVTWAELLRVAGDQWNVVNIRERLRRLRSDPWREYWRSEQRVEIG